MVFNEEERRWELVYNAIFSQDVKASSKLMRHDFHYEVGPKIPFHIKNVNLQSSCE